MTILDEIRALLNTLFMMLGITAAAALVVGIVALAFYILMEAVAAENNVLLMEAFMYRYGKNFEELNKTLASGRLGKIVGMQGNHGYTLDWASPAREDPELGGNGNF